MRDLAFVGTFHEEQHGSKATVAALAEILTALDPDVIFLEMHPDRLADYFGYPGFGGISPYNNLESLAVKQYPRSRDPILVPVDLQHPGDQFDADMKLLENTVEAVVGKDSQLCLAIQARRKADGFLYLNSLLSEQDSAEFHGETHRVVELLGDKRLRDILKRWDEVIEARDNEMLQNIYSHAENHDFVQGVFLVGSAHRRALRRKIAERKSDLIKWTFWGE